MAASSLCGRVQEDMVFTAGHFYLEKGKSVVLRIVHRGMGVYSRDDPVHAAGHFYLDKGKSVVFKRIGRGMGVYQEDWIRLLLLKLTFCGCILFASETRRRPRCAQPS